MSFRAEANEASGGVTLEAPPTVALEGMAAGLPAVATDVGSVREVLLRDLARPAGVVVPSKFLWHIAAAVLELLYEPERAAWMGENGRHLVGKYFSLEECARRHLEVYSGLSKRGLIADSEEVGS